MPCTHAPDPCTVQATSRPRPKSRPSGAHTERDYTILLLGSKLYGYCIGCLNWRTWLDTLLFAIFDLVLPGLKVPKI